MENGSSAAGDLLSGSFEGFTDDSILGTKNSLWTIMKNKYSFTVKLLSEAVLHNIESYCEQSIECTRSGVNGDIYRFRNGDSSFTTVTLYRTSMTMHVQGEGQRKWLINCFSAICDHFYNNSSSSRPSRSTISNSSSIHVESQLSFFSPHPSCTSTPLRCTTTTSSGTQSTALTCDAFTQTDCSSTSASASVQTVATTTLVQSAFAQTNTPTIRSTNTQTVIDGPKISSAIITVREMKNTSVTCAEAKHGPDHIQTSIPMQLNINNTHPPTRRGPHMVEYGVPISNSFANLRDEFVATDDHDVDNDNDFISTMPPSKPPKTTKMSRPSETNDVFPDHLCSVSTPSDVPPKLPDTPSIFVQRRPVAVIVGDSIPRYLVGRRLSRRYRVVNHCIPGMTLQKLITFMPILIRDDNPSIVIVHCGTNNVLTHSTQKMLDLFSQLDYNIKALVPGVQVAFSGLVGNRICPQTDILICHINACIQRFCEDHNSSFIDNCNIPLSYLSRDGIHLNRWGIKQLAVNFISYLRFRPILEDQLGNFQMESHPNSVRTC
ncbi:hypothetical protein HOLleu_15062 [Holothuria leucospilota]|uniref:SGNH hydrolase-type esterase domain-containing protein n=1 Tax=Holothuria leucospilota TaxID=206669 RepID=A0A9Q1HCW2_HOLLE|nr:hypothetical protein HOLleu_15062 [Holothuria leucospilota]